MEDQEYLIPETLQEALKLLRQYGERARVIAGGTSLVIFMKQKLFVPRVLVDIRRLPELQGISYQRGVGLDVGAGTSLFELETSPVVRERFPVLASMLAQIASPRIRCQATVGGSLCHGEPAADPGPPLMVLGATAVAMGPQGERTISLDGFFQGYFQTALAPNEILVRIRIPDLSERSGCAYAKYALRKALDRPMIGVGAWVRLDRDNSTCAEARLAVGAVSPIPVRPREAEQSLKGQRLGEDAFRRAAELAMRAVEPVPDLHASGEYKREMVGVFTRRALAAAVAAIG